MGNQNDFPKYLGVVVKMGSLLIIGTLAWANLSAQVDAVDKVADANTVQLVKVEGDGNATDKIQTEQINEIRTNQAVVTNILKNLDKNQAEMVDTLKEIKQDIKRLSN